MPLSIHMYAVESLHYSQIVDLQASCITQLPCCLYLVFPSWYFDGNVPSLYLLNVYLNLSLQFFLLMWCEIDAVISEYGPGKKKVIIQFWYWSDAHQWELGSWELGRSFENICFVKSHPLCIMLSHCSYSFCCTLTYIQTWKSAASSGNFSLLHPIHVQMF